MRNELEMLKQLRNENIISYYGSFEVKSEQVFSSKVYLVMEYMTGGSLSKIIELYKPLTESAIRNYTHQMLKGLAYLHKQKFIHRDIKAANILLQQDKLGSLKLADFGTMAQLIDDPCFSWQGSILWFSPEVHRNRDYSEASDVWAIGCTVCEMITAQCPLIYNDPNVVKYSSMELYNRLMTTLSPIPNPIHYPITQELTDFLKRCFALNPKERASAEELLQHPFMLKDYENAPLNMTTVASTPQVSTTAATNVTAGAPPATVQASPVVPIIVLPPPQPPQQQPTTKQSPVPQQRVNVNNNNNQFLTPQQNGISCDSICTEYHSDTDEEDASMHENDTEQAAGDSMKM